MAKKMYGGVSRRDIEKARAEVKRARDRMARDDARLNRYTNLGIEALSVAGGAFGSALLQARYGVTSLGPVPIDAAAGTALVVASAFMPQGRWSTDVVAGLGEGMLASFATKLGASLGMQMRPATAPGATFVSGVGNWGEADPYAAYNAYPPAMPAAMPYANPWAGAAATDAQVADAFRRGMG